MFALTISFPLLFAAAFFIYGLNYCLGSPVFDVSERAVFHPAIFSKQGEWIYKRAGIYAKPMLLCVVCMASIWGTIFYLLFTKFYLDFDYFINLCVHVMALAGLNRLLRNFT